MFQNNLTTGYPSIRITGYPERDIGEIIMKLSSWLLVLLLAVTVFNYPNPFSPLDGDTTTIVCTSDTTEEAVLYIYDMAARLVLRQNVSLDGSTIVNVTWDGFSGFNKLVGNGIYPYQIISRVGRRLARGKIWVVN